MYFALVNLRYIFLFSGKKGPLKVNISLLLLDIFNINYNDFTIDIALYTTISWVDNRLKILNGSTGVIGKSIERNVDVSFIRNIWVPEIYIYDLKDFNTGQKNIIKEEGLVISEEKNGDIRITYSFEAQVVFTCPIDYGEFPFHAHTCYLKITSFGKSLESMEFIRDERFGWDPAAVLDSNKVRDYRVNVSYISGEETKKKSWFSNDIVYSIAGLKIELVSKYEKYILIYYLPSTIFTLTSWVSFLLPPTCYPARTTLLVTVFLCQIGVFNAVIKDTPNKDGGSKYVKVVCWFIVKYFSRSYGSRALVLGLHCCCVPVVDQLCDHSDQTWLPTTQEERKGSSGKHKHPRQGS